MTTQNLLPAGYWMKLELTSPLEENNTCLLVTGGLVKTVKMENPKLNWNLHLKKTEKKVRFIKIYTLHVDFIIHKGSSIKAFTGQRKHYYLYLY